MKWSILKYLVIAILILANSILPLDLLSFTDGRGIISDHLYAYSLFILLLIRVLFADFLKNSFSHLHNYSLLVWGVLILSAIAIGPFSGLSNYGHKLLFLIPAIAYFLAFFTSFGLGIIEDQKFQILNYIFCIVSIFAFNIIFSLSGDFRSVSISYMLQGINFIPYFVMTIMIGIIDYVFRNKAVHEVLNFIILLLLPVIFFFIRKITLI